MKGAMILMLLLLYPVLVTARVSTRTTNRRPSRASGEHLKVTVKTGEQALADTDDAVYLQLFGADRKSPALRLHTLADDFELGAVDYFKLITPYVKDIAYVKLKIGGSNGWFVEEVTLDWAAFDQMLVFNFTSWLVNERFLFAYPPYRNPARWRVTVKTGDLPNCGTNAIVTITLSDGKRQTPPYILDTYNYDDFQRDAEDVYDLTTEYIGNIRAISLTVGEGDSWFLAWVAVVSVETGQKYFTPRDEWYR